MADTYAGIGNRIIRPQSEQQRSDQVRNNAGGFVFAVDDWTRAQRFLILGSEGGSYYATQKDLTKENADVIVRLANDPSTGPRLVELIRDVSVNGRAPMQNPTLLALAACTASPDQATRQAAYAAVKDVCRIGTHLYIFTRYVEQFRGWSRGLRRAVGNWYTERSINSLALQTVKYRQREGWSHRDLLRLAHPKTADPMRSALFDWICRPEGNVVREIPLIDAYLTAQTTTDPKVWAQLVTDHNLPWEAFPDAALNHKEVWEAMLPGMGITALIRQMARLTRLGVISPMNSNNKIVTERLTEMESLIKGRVHPLTLLTALYTYRSGHGFRGGDSWTPVPQVIDALDEAFYLAFGAIIPAGKRTLVAVDVSGSMGVSLMNSPLTARDAAAALSMTVVRTEPEHYVMGFSTQFVDLGLSPRMRLDDVLRRTSGLPFAGTDCAVPMMWASQTKTQVDTFVVITDSETWFGQVHPFKALEYYRQWMGIPARLAVLGLTANEFSIAAPDDPGMMDLVGLDTSTPDVLNAFSRGDI